MSTTKTGVEVRTLEVLLDETAEACGKMVALRERVRKLKRGSEGYLDLLPEIAVSASVVTAKVGSLLREIEAIEDSLPDED